MAGTGWRQHRTIDQWPIASTCLRSIWNLEAGSDAAGWEARGRCLGMTRSQFFPQAGYQNYKSQINLKKRKRDGGESKKRKRETKTEQGWQVVPMSPPSALCVDLMTPSFPRKSQ